jgi:vacuolar-type H+-ATPase subunit I/STV1
MIIVRFIDFLRRHLKAVVIFSLCLLVLLAVGDWLLVGKERVHTAAERWFGFWSAFGFFSCTALIFVSKWFGQLGIVKPEDYYGDD